ncbi:MULTISPECIES: DNA-primase RepB domain-containing protein [Paraburkholderia]|uniref:DNA-primase RepB domain-containing protein n=1 Tax=Paraburkholderia TaxID=1822464 RepID=UPI0022517267|nr:MULTISPECIES: DNA-primase RepB domain-containing protein [Paraburkholderia]MCX4170693.1 DNA-primase RepB domain-containing protein [Paraburkholderia madseniana]MDQ6458705.1 RepB family DNA primase [Paraburkholderia madseniana]
MQLTTSIVTAQENNGAARKITPIERVGITEEFLAELGRGLPETERVMVAYADEVTPQINEDGTRNNSGFWPEPYKAEKYIKRDKNSYVVISSSIKTPHPKTGEPRFWRSRENFGHGLALMVDDIGSDADNMGKGSKGAMTIASLSEVLPPTVVIETSHGNNQCWYFMDAPVADRERFGAFLYWFAARALDEGGDRTIKDITRYGRLPIGINNKTLEDGTLKYGDANGKPFQVRMVSADYSLRYSMDEIADAFGFRIVVNKKTAAPAIANGEAQFDAYWLSRAIEIANATQMGESGAMQINASGKYRMICPWGDEHGGSADGAVIWGPDARQDQPYAFHCSHDTCQKAGRKWGVFVDKIVMAAIESELDEVNALWSDVPNALDYVSAAAAAEAVEKAKATSEAAAKVEPASEAKTEQDTGDTTAKAAPEQSNDNDRAEAADAAARNAEKSRAELESRAAQDLGVGRNWYHGWWYSLSEGRVCRPGNKFTYSIADFNATFGGHFFSMKSDDKFNCKSAFAFVQNVQKFKIAAGTAYVCGRPSVFEWKGSVHVNMFNAKSIPATATDYTDEGWAAIETIRSHIRNLTGDETAATYIESWIAMNVKKPGELIGMAPLIKGIEGDGKTIIFQGLMKALLGDANIGLVSGDEVTENTGWAKGSAVVAIEELKTDSGNNRHHVTNRMKQYITNDTVDVVDKYIKRHETMNATNYVAMTNYSNALPLNNKDRRWMVIFTQWKDISQLIAKVGPYDAYFANIGHAIATQAAQLRKFFMEYELAAGFHWNMRAPETEGKLKMIGIEDADSGINKIKTYLSEGELGVCEEILCTRYLQEHIQRDTGEKRRMTRQIAMMLEQLDYTRVPRDIKWKGKAHTVYVKDPRYFAADLLDGEKLPTENLADAKFMEKFVNDRLRKMLDETDTKPNNESYVPAAQVGGF